MFVQNQKRVYQQMDGVKNINNEKPNAEESKQFWSNIWNNEKKHERNAWLYVSRKNGGRRIIGCENSVKSEKKWPRVVRQKQYRTITSCSQNKYNYNTQGNS